MDEVALNQELHDATLTMDAARTAAQRGDWVRAEEALVEAQIRIGRLLQGMELRRQSPVRPKHGRGKG
jgi:hypothetical protein